MAPIPLKAQYRPTLPQMLAPYWRRSSRSVRVMILILLGCVLAIAIGVTQTLERASIRYGGPVPFDFEYRDLYRVAPEPGGYVKVQRDIGGPSEQTFAVDPLTLPRYQGSLTGELPLFASSYIRQMRESYRDFALQGEGKTRINAVPGYTIFYTASIGGRRMFGRDVLLLPERPGVRVGVRIVMHTTPTADRQVRDSTEVASDGPLSMALHTFTFD